MRISDWSADVCSSDLLPSLRGAQRRSNPALSLNRPAPLDCFVGLRPPRNDGLVAAFQQRVLQDPLVQVPPLRVQRSEEHTSELQSLMRISYAVFCLTQKTQSTIHNTSQTTLT